jgi:hypothetical protein
VGCCCTPEQDEKTEPSPLARTECPACDARGRRVKSITLDSLLVADAARNEGEAYRFCKTIDCEVAWFGETSGHAIPRAAARVRIGQKERVADRTLCYCFGYSAADIERELAERGASTIPEQITARCRQGEDRCPQTNPQGACCLGNVRAAVKAAARASSPG